MDNAYSVDMRRLNTEEPKTQIQTTDTRHQTYHYRQHHKPETHAVLLRCATQQLESR